MDVVALLFGSDVAPDQCWPDNIAGSIEHHCAMHLPRKSNARNAVAREVRRHQGPPNSKSGGAPPIRRTLFGPADLGRSEPLVLLSGGGDGPSELIDDEHACSARADVYAENVHGRRAPSRGPSMSSPTAAMGTLPFTVF